MSTNRRSFLFGAVAVPAGIALPDSIARELALPPPEMKAGAQLILRPNEGSRDAVWRLSDVQGGVASITLVDDNGRVVGYLSPRSFEVRCDPMYYIGSSGVHPSPRYYFDNALTIDVALSGIMGRL